MPSISSSHAAPWPKPEWTRRSRVPPLPTSIVISTTTVAGSVLPSCSGLPSTSYGRACSSTSRMNRGGSHASMRTVPLHPSPQLHVMLPPAPGSTWAASGNQRTSSCAWVTASQTSLVDASRSMVMSNARAFSSVMGCLRMDGREKTKAPAARGVFIVILRSQRRDRVRELLCERGARARGGEPDLGIDGEGGQPFVVAFGTMIERRDVTERSRRGCDQVGRAESIAWGIVAGTEQAKRFGTDDESLRGRAQDALDAVALAAFFDELDEAFAFEFLEVVVDALPGHAQFARQSGGGIRFGQVTKELAAAALEEDGGAVCATDDFEVHGAECPTDSLFCQDTILCRQIMPTSGRPPRPP